MLTTTTITTTDAEMHSIKEIGIGKDCIGQTVLGGDRLRDVDGNGFSIVRDNGRWVLEKWSTGKRFAILHPEQLAVYKRVK